MTSIVATCSTAREKPLARGNLRGAILTVGLSLCLCHATAAAQELTADNLLEIGKLEPSQVEALLGGEILPFVLDDGSTDDLTESNVYAGVAGWVSIPLDRLVDFLAEVLTRSSAARTVHPLSSDEPFPSIRYGSEDAKEVERFLAFDSGSDVNLSADEHDQLRQLGLKAPLNPTDLVKFSDAYGQILERRFVGYRDTGLEGVAPYWRGDEDSVSPGEDLALATQYLSRNFAPYLPDFAKDILHIPEVGDRKPYFYLFREIQDGRPAYILVHRLFDVAPGHAVMFNREYFVGHGYDAMQFSLICLPYRGGTLIGMGTDVSTDAVAGWGSSIRHKVGRSRVSDLSTQRLTEIRDQLLAEYASRPGGGTN